MYMHVHIAICMFNLSSMCIICMYFLHVCTYIQPAWPKYLNDILMIYTSICMFDDLHVFLWPICLYGCLADLLFCMDVWWSTCLRVCLADLLFCMDVWWSTCPHVCLADLQYFDDLNACLMIFWWPVCFEYPHVYVLMTYVSVWMFSWSTFLMTYIWMFWWPCMFGDLHVSLWP